MVVSLQQVDDELVIAHILQWNILNSHPRICGYVLMILERGRDKEGKREREEHQLVASHMRSHSMGLHWGMNPHLDICSSWDWNQQPFSAQEDAPINLAIPVKAAPKFFKGMLKRQHWFFHFPPLFCILSQSLVHGRHSIIAWHN